MKRFSKITEEIENTKYFKIKATIELIVKAENDGEAGYTADSVLNGIEETYTYSIITIEETTNDDISNISDLNQNNEL